MKKKLYIVSACEVRSNGREVHPLIPRVARTRRQAVAVLREFIADEIDVGIDLNEIGWKERI